MIINKQKRSLSFIFFTLLVILVLIGLGTWQLQRKTEKEALLHALSQIWLYDVQNVDEIQEPVPLKPLFATGHYVPEKTIFLQAKTHQGKNGVYVLDVFQTNKGKFLLVQRGWSSKEYRSIPSGTITIEGASRTPSPPTYFQPLNQPPVYFWIDLDLLSKELHLPLLPYYLVAKKSDDPQIFATDPMPLPRNHHLQYAITWYSLAFAILSMLLWYLKNLFKRNLHDRTDHNA